MRRVCRDGKLNPHSWESAMEVAQQLGARALCMMNDFREEIIDLWGLGRMGAIPSEGVGEEASEGAGKLREKGACGGYSENA
jgi:hypothetical protein